MRTRYRVDTIHLHETERANKSPQPNICHFYTALLIEALAFHKQPPHIAIGNFISRHSKTRCGNKTGPVNNKAPWA